jgi:drug/metabolite transporter (DMT)-like permease
MVRFPVLKALSGSQKVFKLFGVGLDRRQGLILLGSVFCYWLLYKQLSKVISLTTPQAVVLFAPLVVLAVAVAFVRHERRHLVHPQATSCGTDRCS